ncbi:aldehyde dehydrogenase family protein [Mycobacterium intermedium]|uniref:Aldehyde dehydrogenase n=1 Tax=Mycobacterium intermedium TaxID=28445 RepID=A0A1E3SJ54_MYCIE|nr:aldehyde dehydrogenase family protein [Mycobacterium intermedium]MCV6964915.1 aldehyde dehydrogenase family protein [Mycobacterium intermedium]ODR01683.1 aldehyde dehydrogenase [Mycobacterium intermedium]OPE52203.1 aldehyde dehydrogenase family protein [Mycobacterium intermedium]ORA98838.1 aldehyde dehydrogenase family protein [Mycobacterium intermedium]
MLVVESPPTVGEAEVLASVRRAFATGRTRSLQWRRQQLRGIERMVSEQETAIAAALAADLGRAPAEAWLGDIASTRAEAVYALRHLRKWMRKQRVSLPLAQLPGRGWVQYEPLGVVLIIGPWNYPFYLCLGPLIAAVAAGNCAVVKPSEFAPESSTLLTQLLPKYVDPEAVRVVEGDASVTRELLAAGFDHALFTGGTEVGRKVMTAAAPTLTPVTLELGGKSPVIVAADADIDVTARRIAWIKLLNSGQTCIAPDYVLAERAITDQLVDRVSTYLRQFRSSGPEAGVRVVNVRQFDRLAEMIRGTRGRVVTGGALDRENLRIEPTVVVDPPADDPVMAEEIFGPILPVLTVESLDAAVAFVKSRPKPLALYVFTSSPRLGRDLVDRVPSGGAVINHVAMHCLTPQLPFGGVGASGMGAYHGKWGFEALSHRRAVLAKPARPDPRFVYPPHSKRALSVMRRLF